LPGGKVISSYYIIYGLGTSEFSSGGNKTGDCMSEWLEDSFFSEEIRLMQGGEI